MGEGSTVVMRKGINLPWKVEKKMRPIPAFSEGGTEPFMAEVNQLDGGVGKEEREKA